MNRRTLYQSCAVLAAVVWISACSYQKHFESSPSDYGSRTETHERTGYRTYNTQLRAADHNNGTLAFVQSTTDAVDDLKGIRSSFVMVTDKNVYVAVVPDNTATGLKGKGTILFSDRTIASSGVDDHSDVSYVLPPGNIVMDKYSFDTIPNPQDLSSEFVHALSACVAQYHPGVQNVFVSANQQFINRLSEYAHEAWRGQSLQPYIQDFNALVKDHFGDHGIIETNP
ncbi:hypothetical protein FE784_13400 [Paenibacillus hemerocallicola]|jgi:hypothetical protein|uniref:Uncharacterized protein n=1 Tax=Paenibacillus hemerocallicola TaxID=1172614 RepID=A0A5C4TBP5_9BACL|nr:hypothetical protein [Paenibacillus hemerocallicola]TNJ65907.1 hypothetical protein FE784_13400 [Paenibacillus hemerocallicola]